MPTKFDETIQIEEIDNVGHENNGPGGGFDIESFTTEEVNEQLSIWASFQLSRSRLKTAANNSAFFAGFGIIAIVEVNLGNDDDHPLPTELLYYLAITSVLQAAVHLMIILVGNCIGPHLDAAAEYCESYHELIEIESPHVKLKTIIDASWMISTTIGTILFMFQVAGVAVCKYWQYSGTGNPDYTDTYDLDVQGKLLGFISMIMFLITIFMAVVYFIYLHQAFQTFMKDRFKLKRDPIREVRSPSKIFSTDLWIRKFGV